MLLLSSLEACTLSLHQPLRVVYTPEYMDRHQPHVNRQNNGKTKNVIIGLRLWHHITNR